MSDIPVNVPVDTVKLRVEKTVVRKIPTEAFYYLVDLKYLWVTYNSISTIASSSFYNLKVLHELRLDGNLLSSFPWESLQEMPNLRSLDLHNNRLSTVPADAGRYLQNVKYLDISSNKLTTLPSDLIDIWPPFSASPNIGTDSHPERVILGLQDNPWFCDCRISKLIELSKTFEMAVVLLDPLLMCSGPENLAGVLFQRAELEQCLKPSVMTSATKMTSPLGSNVLLRCDATGYPTPILIWTKSDGSPVNNTGLQDNPWFCDCRISKLIELSKTFEMAVVLLDPLLTCSGPENLAGVLFQRAELEQCLKPSVMTSATKMTSPLGSNVLLRCDATGYPTPILIWTKSDGSPVNNTECCRQVASSFFKEKLPRTLKTNLVQESPGEGIRWSIISLNGILYQDAGEYRCKAKNLAGMSEASITLTVVGVITTTVSPLSLNSLQSNVNRSEDCDSTVDKSIANARTKEAPVPYLIFSHGNAIFRIDREGTNHKRLVTNTGISVLLDFHYNEERIYWVDSDKGLVQRVFMNGTKREKVCSVGKGISGFTLNWIQKSIIWTNHQKGSIEVADIDGRNSRVLLENVSQPSSITVAPNQRFIFWISDGLVPSINRANVDGEKVITVLSTTEKVKTLSLDFIDKRLFWVQYGADDESAIGSCDYNGDAVHIMKQLTQSQPFGMSLFAEYIYYSELKTGTIRRANKYTGKDVVVINPKPSFLPPADVKVVHRLKQPAPSQTAEQGCDATKEDCLSVCTRDADKEQCECRGGYVLSKDGRSCEDVNECAFWNHGCTLGCENIPGSYFCTCPGGFALLSDMKTCHGCTAPDNGGCSQVCVALSPVKWECKCMPGYRLKPDGKHCSATGPRPYLLFANIQDIRRINFDGTAYHSLLDKQMGRVLALDYDPVQSKVYFAHTGLKWLERANLDGSEREVLLREDLDYPEGLAVDWINRKLLSRIERSDLNGVHREVIISEGVNKPRGIAVHPLAKKLFWTDWGEKPCIESSSLEGGVRLVIANTTLVSPSGITIDYLADKLYWCDAKRSVIEVADLDGSNRRILTQNEVDYLADKLYWCDAKRSVIEVADLDGSNRRILTQNEVVSRATLSHSQLLMSNTTLRDEGIPLANPSPSAATEEAAVHKEEQPKSIQVAEIMVSVSRATLSHSQLLMSNTTLRDEGIPLANPSPSAATEEAAVHKEEQPKNIQVAEIMVSDQDDCSALECDVNAQCFPAQGGAVCQCLEGFTGDGKACNGALDEGGAPY
ncbi:UNVERIFIED_CONTAM: hypothetical protein FKN15_024634 [Acipenser sinensis]